MLQRKSRGLRKMQRKPLRRCCDPPSSPALLKPSMLMIQKTCRMFAVGQICAGHFVCKRGICAFCNSPTLKSQCLAYGLHTIRGSKGGLSGSCCVQKKGAPSNRAYENPSECCDSQFIGKPRKIQLACRHVQHMQSPKISKCGDLQYPQGLQGLKSYNFVCKL